MRRGSGSVVTWRRAQMVLWSAQRMSVPQIARLAFTSEDRVRDVLHNFNADGFDSLYPRYAGGHPPVFTLAQRREIKKIAKSAPADHGLPFSRWSLAKLADFLVAEGWSRTSPTKGSARCSARRDQLTPAQANTRRPEPVNIAEYRIRRKQVLGGLTHEYYVAA